jgi:hypothetical protein
MRILPVALIGLAFLAGCASSPTRTQQSAAPSAQPMGAPSGAMSSSGTTAQGDVIDRFAAAVEARRARY